MHKEKEKKREEEEEGKTDGSSKLETKYYT